MDNKAFILQRISIYAGREIDPDSDKQVEELLLRKFDVHLPQRASMNEALAAAKSTHEVLGLILRYRTMDN